MGSEEGAKPNTTSSTNDSNFSEAAAHQQQTSHVAFQDHDTDISDDQFATPPPSRSCALSIRSAESKETLKPTEGHDAPTSTEISQKDTETENITRAAKYAYLLQDDEDHNDQQKESLDTFIKDQLAKDNNRGQSLASRGTQTASNCAAETRQDVSDSEKGVDLEAGSAKKEGVDLIKEADPNVVDWDGPNDPLNALNWPDRRKKSNIAVMAAITFLTPLASSMLAPGVPEIMKEFKSTNIELASFVVSVFVLGYAFGPLVIAPLSEIHGRVPIYHIGNLGFVVFTVACALSRNLNMLIGFRFLAGLFGSTPLTIGGGTIADMTVQEKRGRVIAIWALGPLMGPAIGPIAGGFLANSHLGWRWIFWILSITAGFLSILCLIFFRETYPRVLLERKTNRLRKETGNPNIRSALATDLAYKDFFKRAIVRPAKLLFGSPIVFATSFYVSVIYSYLYLLFTTITEVYESIYHFSPGIVGLTYLGIGIGCFLGVVIFGLASDRILKHMAAKGEMKPEYRIPPLIPGSFFVPIGLFIYGWTTYFHTHWIAPIIGTALVGLGLVATSMPIQTYLIDTFTVYAASALAANVFLRSLLGALLPLAGRQLYITLGLGWGNSLLGFIALGCCPIPVIFFKYGERIRKNKKWNIDLTKL